MKLRRLALSTALTALGALGFAGNASAAPSFVLDLHHAQTNFVPGSGAGAEVTTVTPGAAPATNEVQQLIVKSMSPAPGVTDFSGGGPHFRLSFGASTTPNIVSNASALEVQTALNALPSIGGAGGSVAVAGGPGDYTGSSPYVITFGGSLAGTDVAQITTSFATPGNFDALDGGGDYWVDVDNVGDADTSGPVTVTIELPPGITFGALRKVGLNNTDQAARANYGPAEWSCPSASPGDSVVVCATNDIIARHQLSRTLAIQVNVDPSASGVLVARARVEGGGAASAATATEPTPISSTPAPFGIQANSWTPDFFEADGTTLERQASSHPDLGVFPFDLNTVDRTRRLDAASDDLRKDSTEPIRDLIVDLPPGFLGVPTAVGECTQAEFTVNVCPFNSQVGRLDVTLRANPAGRSNRGWSLTSGVFNLFHPRGVINDLGLSIFSNPAHIRASLNPADRYAIRTTVPFINEELPLISQKLTIWGVPADESHDSERCPQFSSKAIFGFAFGGGDTIEECSTDAEPRPFLTLPAQCDTDNASRIHSVDSWEHPGVFAPEVNYVMPGKMTGCEKPQFEPTVRIVPTGKQANTPTGIEVSIQTPQNLSPDGLSTPPIKSTVVTFPAGTTLNPAFADGLEGCTLGQIGLGTNNPVACPDNSRIGEISLTTPLLPRTITGSMYLAKQRDNFFGSTFALYMAVEDTEDRGALVKIPGRIDLDPRTGDITTTFDDLPQFPVDDFTLRFRSGQRAPLVNPPTCGTQRISIEVTSYALPNRVIDASNTYLVSEGPGGSPCPPGASERPFNPKQGAGTLNPTAGSYSPFVFGLKREDTEQDISTVTSTLPAGLIAKLTGVTNCPDSALASISTAEGGGRAELANPSCPASSLLGQLSTGVGSGTNPNYFNGNVYQGGPYKDAPLSLAIVVPAIAGPYDFGNVVVRTAIYLDPKTSQVRAISDPLPSIVHGVLLHVREIHLDMSRDQFMLNPTSCQPMSIDTQLLSDLGALASPSSRFQVGECSSLDFKPKLALKLRGGTKRGAHPQLTGILTPRPGDANIASLSVAFPRSEFLENAHIRTICTRADFAADRCPAGSIYGRVTAFTPLLDEPLEGLVRLRSSSNLLPDAVGDLRGPPSRPIKVESVGRVDSINGGIRTTFDYVPDAPVSRVVVAMQGGKKGLLVNSRDICRRVYRAKVIYTAHNGARYVQHPKMQANCKGKRAKKAERRAHSRAR